MRAARASEKGAHTGTSKDTFSICLKEGARFDGDHQRLFQEISLLSSTTLRWSLFCIAHRHDLRACLRVALSEDEADNSK